MAPVDRERHARRLAELLDAIDRAEEDMREEMKERKGRIAKMKKEALHVRDLVSGRAAEQLTIPDAADDVAGVLAFRGRKDDDR